MTEIAIMGYLVDEADSADGADGTDETDVAEMALCMNALFYFEWLGQKDFKNRAYNGLWEPYAVTVGWMGRTDHTP